MISKRLLSGLAALVLTAGAVAAPVGESGTKLLVPEMEVRADDYVWSWGDFWYGYGPDDGAILSAYNGSDTEVTVPKYVEGDKGEPITIIGDAFRGNTNITKVILPDSIFKIDQRAFEGCTSLKEIVVTDNSLTTIGNYAFSDCTGLTSFEVPEGVTELGYGVFSNCTSLESVTIPSTVTEIPGSTFADCTSLKSFVIPDNITNIGYAAFSDCTALESITIPDSVTEIEERAFENCTSLEEVELPDSITEIKGYIFEGCTSLKNVIIPYSVTTIESFAFGECTALTEITIPDSVTTIEGYAFYYCTALTEITIPNSVTTLDGYAFCLSGVTDIYYDGTMEQWNAIDISEVEGLYGITVHCTDGDIENTAHYHQYKYELTQEPTCTESGYYTYTCEVCGDNYTVTYPAYGHFYYKETEEVAPSYESEGYTLHTCMLCGDTYKDNFTDKKVLGTAQTTTYTSVTDAVRINWEQVEDADGYRIYRYENGKWKTVKTIGKGDTTTYRESGLKAGINYSYKVKAFVRAKDGTPIWGAASQEFVTATDPVKPAITKFGKAKTAVRLYWEDIECSGYKIQQYDSASKSWKTIKLVSAGKTNYRVNGLKSGKTYKFRIQAYTRSGDTKAYSKWSATKTVTTKK